RRLHSRGDSRHAGAPSRYGEGANAAGVVEDARIAERWGSGGMNTPHDCSGEAAAYVLGALEPAEAEAFRRHLKECAICRDEVEALEGVVQALPMSAPQHPLPRRLRRRVIRAVRAEQAPGQPRRSAGMSWAGSRPALAALAMAAVIALVI